MSYISILKSNVSLVTILAIIAATFVLFLVPLSPTRTASCLRSEGVFTTSCLSASRTTVLAGVPEKFDENMEALKPLGDSSIPEIIGKVIQALIGFIGLIALVMFVSGGIRWMLAAGNTEAVDKAKKTITWAVLGLVMVFASYAIVNLVIGSLAA